MTAPALTTTVDYALQLAGRGLHIFPCREKPGEPYFSRKDNAWITPKAKEPYWHKDDLPNGKDNATTDPDQIRIWWERWPGALVGIYCEKSGFFALDIDNKDGRNGSETFSTLVETHGAGQPVEVGPVQDTPSGGQHLLFKLPQGVKIPNNADKLGEGLDLRSNGYICSGGAYAWLPGHGPDQPLTDAPAWLLDLIRNLTRPAGRPAATTPAPAFAGGNVAYWLEKALDQAAPGNRNDKGFWLACQLRDNGATESEAELTMIDYARQVPGDGYTEAEALASLREAYKGPRRDPARSAGAAIISGNGNGYHLAEARPALQAPAAELDPAPTGQGSLTDTANAERLAGRYGRRLRWVAEWGWLVWDGKRWQRDREGLAMRRAKDTAKAIYREAAAAEDDAQAKAVASWAGKSLNRTRLEAMLALAEPELSARPDAFDRDPWILCVLNGLLDLRTGELKPADPSCMTTKIAGANYDPAARCPTWESFLNRVMDGDREMIDYLRRAVGYTLTGDVGEQILFFMHGTGANGKSTFVNAILAMLGEYARQAAPQLLLAGDRHPTELADLQGARFVATIEVEEGRRLAEVLTKQLTGGDRMKARFTHRDWFEFEPSHKIWLAANHKPVIMGTDHAIWRRIKLIPFAVTIPEPERDPQLLTKLRAELPGILAWAVRGCLEYQRAGLQTPEKVREATNEYQASQDTLAAFFDECCVLNDLASVTAGALLEAYNNWAKRAGEDPLSQRRLSERLRERGYKTDPRDRDRFGRALYRGVGLRAENSEND